MTLAVKDREDLIEFLIKKGMGEYSQWESPEIGLTIGPSHPDLYEPFEALCDEMKTGHRVYLDQLSDDELISLKHPNTGQDDEFVKEWLSMFLDGVTALRASMPSDIAVGFGHPNLRADFDYWGKMQRYSIYEALALSVGMEPEHYPEEKIKALQDREKRKRDLLPAQKFLVRRCAQFGRFFKNMNGRFSAESPVRLKNWFDEVEMEVHPEFYAQLEKRSTPPALKEPVERAAKLVSTERETLLKLVAAMSCEQYSFDPSASRSDTVTSMQSDLAAVGLQLDNKTILKWLREASKLVDPQYFLNED